LKLRFIATDEETPCVQELQKYVADSSSATYLKTISAVLLVLRKQDKHSNTGPAFEIQSIEELE
jgi:hypothetical protein